jgi:hypothetical protein
MKIFRETQKKVDKGKMIDYPILSIQPISEDEVKVVCRDTSSIQSIKRGIELNQRIRMADRMPALEYQCLFSEKSSTLEFTLSGNIAIALSDFAEAFFISEPLKTDIIASFSGSSLSCK